MPARPETVISTGYFRRKTHNHILRKSNQAGIIVPYIDGESPSLQSPRERAPGCKARVLHETAPASRVRGERILSDESMKSAGRSRYRAGKGTDLFDLC